MVRSEPEFTVIKLIITPEVLALRTIQSMDTTPILVFVDENFSATLMRINLDGKSYKLTINNSRLFLEEQNGNDHNRTR